MPNGPLAAAIAQLAALTVPGVAHHWGIDALPERISMSQLPALLVLPLDRQDDRLFQDAGDGFRAEAFADGLRTVNLSLTHLLLIAPAGNKAGLRVYLPALIDAIDAYCAALAVDPTLGGVLLEAARVRIEPGITGWGADRYVGCAFRHDWLIALQELG